MDISGRIAERVRRFREALGITQAEVGRRCGWTQQSFQNKESGKRKITLEEAIAISRALGVDIGDLIGNQDVRECLEKTKWSLRDYTLVPYFDIHACAGDGIFVDGEFTLGTVAFKTEWLFGLEFDPERLGLIRVSGMSMSPSILDGDMLLVDTSRRARTIKTDVAYVVLYDGELMVKRIEKSSDGGVVLYSDNPINRNITVPPTMMDLFAVKGRVIWLSRTL